MGATKRIIDIGQGLHRLGWEINLLAARSPYKNYDKAQEGAFPGNVIRTPFSMAYPVFCDFHPGARRLYRIFWRMRGREYFQFKMESWWMQKLSTWCKTAGLPTPDVIWVVSTGTMNSLAAGKTLAEHFRKPLILEIHDPISSINKEPLIPLLEEQLRSCYEVSSAIVTTTEALADWLESNYTECKGKVFPIHLSYDDVSEPVTISRNDTDLVLVHAGALYWGNMRNARSLVSSLANVFEKEPSCRGRIRLRLLGGGKGGEEAAKLARRLGIAEAVEALPECAYSEAIEEMSKADALVLIKFAGKEFEMQIPGKLFQYLSFGKPILGIVPLSSEAAVILRNTGLGLIAEYEEVEIVTDHILNLWKHRENLGNICKANWEYIRQFSRSSMIEKLNILLTNVLNKVEGD